MWEKTSSALSFFCHNNRDCSFRELGFGSREREWGGVWTLFWFVDLVSRQLLVKGGCGVGTDKRSHVTAGS